MTENGLLISKLHSLIVLFGLFRTPASAVWRRVSGPIMSSSSSCRPANIVAERQTGSTHIYYHLIYEFIYIYIYYMCVCVLFVIFILYASQYKSCAYTYLRTIHIAYLHRINRVLLHDMQWPAISSCWLNIFLKEARVSRFRFQIMSFGGSDSLFFWRFSSSRHFPLLIEEILHQFIGIF